ncbi:hypothetical protein J6590_097725 [Homalodisca vitripennis]|nr:hypothetical protein J6590_097725 [Homalodisca vitripennis]
METDNEMSDEEKSDAEMSNDSSELSEHSDPGPSRKRGRRKERDSSTWKRNVNKKRRAEGTISASSSYLGSFIPFNFLVKGANLNLFIPEDIPGMPRKQLKPAKEKDLTSLFSFLSAEEQCWFNNVIEKPKVDDNVVAENEESDIEEESDYENILAYEFP